MNKITRSGRESLRSLALDIFSDLPEQVIDTSLTRSINPYLLPKEARKKLKQTKAEYEVAVAALHEDDTQPWPMPTFPMHSIVVRHEKVALPSGTLVVNGLHVARVMQWAFDGPVIIGNETFELHKEDTGLTIVSSCNHGAYSHGIRHELPPFGDEIFAIDDSVNRIDPATKRSPEVSHKAVKPLEFIRGTLQAVRLQREADRRNDDTFSI